MRRGFSFLRRSLRTRRAELQSPEKLFCRANRVLIGTPSENINRKENLDETAPMLRLTVPIGAPPSRESG
jgi:hypothetical protein